MPIPRFLKGKGKGNSPSNVAVDGIPPFPPFKANGLYGLRARARFRFRRARARSACLSLFFDEGFYIVFVRISPKSIVAFLYANKEGGVTK